MVLKGLKGPDGAEGVNLFNTRRRFSLNYIISSNVSENKIHKPFVDGVIF